MLDIMLDSDAAISAGGQTLYELARVGVPTISIAVAENQKHNVYNWQKVGFSKFAGYWDDKSLLSNILKIIELLNDYNIRLDMGKSGKLHVDGQGSQKIARYSLNKFYADKINLHLVNYQDIYDVFELSNEEEVRENSFNSSKIKFKEHEKWLENKISDLNTLFLKIIIEENFAGQIRFELDKNAAIISISIKKKFRGLDLGNNIIEKSIKYLRLNLPEIKIVKAYIKKSNQKSIKLFEKANFMYRKNVQIEGHDALEYMYRIRD